MSNYIKKICLCGTEFTVIPYRKDTAKYCSRYCLHKYKIVVPNSGQFKKGETEYLRRRNVVPIVCGVYKIMNPNNQIYIGSSRTIYRRWLRHREARKNVPIHRSIKKYGWKAHKWDVISQLPYDITDIDLINQEQVYINAYYNCGAKMLNIREAGHYLKNKKVI